MAHHEADGLALSAVAGVPRCYQHILGGLLLHIQLILVFALEVNLINLCS